MICFSNEEFYISIRAHQNFPVDALISRAPLTSSPEKAGWGSKPEWSHQPRYNSNENGIIGSITSYWGWTVEPFYNIDYENAELGLQNQSWFVYIILFKQLNNSTTKKLLI